MIMLSIIIPVYNVEHTLERCISSVLSQRIDRCEILLVDDGSTDRSGEIADQWARKDQRIRVYHKTNGGPSDSRNYGLDRMKGNYVTFVDSDDTLAPDTLQPLIDLLEKHPEYDMLEYSVLQNAGSHNTSRLTLDNRVYHDGKDWLSAHGCRHCWVWNKLYKSSMFAQLRFPTHLRRFEDMWLMGRLLKLHPVIATTAQGLYEYYQNSNGLMATIKDYKELLHAQMDIVELHHINLHHRRWHRLYMDIYNIQLYVYIQTGKILIPSQRVVPAAYDGVQGLVKSLALDILGLRLSCRLFKLFHKHIKPKKT